MQMALYLITGIGGFIGSSLARALLACGEQVRGVDNFSTGKRENLADILPSIGFHEADILDLDAMHVARQRRISPDFEPGLVGANAGKRERQAQCRSRGQARR